MRLLVEHLTTYRYSETVQFGPHRLMLTPRESHDLSIVDFQLTCEPEATLTWHLDVFGNSVAIARFERPADQLHIFSRILLDHRGSDSLAIPIEPGGRRVPMLYGDGEWPDLAPTALPHWPDSEAAIRAWIQPIVDRCGGQTLETLAALNQELRGNFTYQVRHSPGVRAPDRTLELREGSCRDFAILFIEAVRHLGLSARFVSGYLHDPSLDHSLQGAGYTHAWAQVYLPGPGWVQYDPTNALINSGALVRTAVARSPDQAVPVQGTYKGRPEAFLDMDAQVTVQAVDTTEMLPASTPIPDPVI